MRNIATSLLLTILVGAASACAPAATPSAPTAAPARATVIRLEKPVNPDVTDIPRLMAMDALQAQGYTVETPAFDDNATTILAMERGDLDFVTLADLVGIQAIQKEAPLQIVMDDSANTFMVVASNDIQQCADLAGQPVAMIDLTGANASLLYHYIDKECPGTQPNYLVIKGGSNRLAALFAGQVSATTLNMYDFITLDSQQAANVHALVYYAQEFPGYSPLSTFVRRDLVEQYPETVKDVIRAILEARRQVQDPQVLADEIVKRLELDPEQAQMIAKTYLERRVWNVNGAYDSLDAVQAKIDWYTPAGDLPEGMKADQVADLSYLNAVVEEIGRQ
jgi:ABC-type nitrate/sulfonate/bicarbonate transport system substrate-binding protein